MNPEANHDRDNRLETSTGNAFPVESGNKPEGESPQKPAEELTKELQVESSESMGAEIANPLQAAIDAMPDSNANRTADADSDAATDSETNFLRDRVRSLEAEIARLNAERQQPERLAERLTQTVEGALEDLAQRRESLEIAIEQLERRKERIQKEMRTTFAGASQELAVRVQGFKDYLVGSLQDLAASAEQLELLPAESAARPAPSEREPRSPYGKVSPASAKPSPTNFSDSRFQDRAKQIRSLLDRYRTAPDYYGAPWQLRRTFEPIHAERVSYWFFSQGGRGALRSMGGRLQNILIVSAIVSCLRDLYGSRIRILVLANTPERLGEWRRGLQDCLGISRGDFGPERGVILFESAESLSQKADRLMKDGKLPFIAIDDTEDRISLSILQFPLWLAFAPDPAAGLLPERD